MMAKKMTSDRDVDSAVEEAPSAIPSAHACTMRPIVAAGVFFVGGGGKPGVARGVTAALCMPMPLRLNEDELCGPRARFDNEMCIGWYFGFAEARASGRCSTRNMRM